MGFGFIAARFSLFLRFMGAKENFAMAHHGGLSLFGGIALIILGVIVNVCAAVRYHRQIRSIDRGEFREAFGSKLALSIAGSLAAIGIAVAVYLSGLGP